MPTSLPWGHEEICDRPSESFQTACLTVCVVVGRILVSDIFRCFENLVLRTSVGFENPTYGLPVCILFCRFGIRPSACVIKSHRPSEKLSDGLCGVAMMKSVYAEKVLQRLMSPFCRPRLNQAKRSADEPWVKLSGTA